MYVCNFPSGSTGNRSDRLSLKPGRSAPLQNNWPYGCGASLEQDITSTKNRYVAPHKLPGHTIQGSGVTARHVFGLLSHGSQSLRRTAGSAKRSSTNWRSVSGTGGVVKACNVSGAGPGYRTPV